MLEAAGPVAANGNDALDFQKATAGELIGHILNVHHTYTKTEMTRLQALIEKVIAAHGENHSELLDIGRQFQTLCADLRPHMFKEEQILFPYIVELEKSVLQNRRLPWLRSARSRIPFA
jgi:regulator of cell morphogenesis and NO signaling